MNYFVSALAFAGVGALSLGVSTPTFAAPPSPPGTASLPVYKAETPSPRLMSIKRPTINAAIVGDSDQSNDNGGADSDASQSARDETSRTDDLGPSGISAIQRALRKRGYYLEVNGVWDKATVANVKSLQYKYGLKVTGYPDQATLKLLGLSHASSASVRKPAPNSAAADRQTAGNGQQGAGEGARAAKTKSQGKSATKQATLSREQIKQLQRRLNRQGYQVDQTGRWNDRTRSAILRLQKQRGLKQTGYPDRVTRRALSITDAMWESWGS